MPPIRSIQTTAASGARTLDPTPLEVYASEFNVQWVFNRTGAGHCQAEVQYTLDNILEAGVSALWVVSKVLTTADTATAQTITHPMAAIRLAITSASGNNQVAFRVLQTGS